VRLLFIPAAALGLGGPGGLVKGPLGQESVLSSVLDRVAPTQRGAYRQ
jgi:hypothetical protein